MASAFPLHFFPPSATGRPYRILAALFFLALASVLYLPSLEWLPRGIHEWAQADRLALAVNFYDHGLRFFRPQTLNLSSFDGVVGVEFPLLPYLTALGAKLTGRGSLVLWHRGVNVVFSGVGCYYLFCLVFERTRQLAAALVPGVFLATSPVFAYYAGSFLPDPASTALALVGAYYLLRYPRHPRFRYLLAALGVLTLATLIKTSAAIYLLAAMGTVLLWSYLVPSVLATKQKLIFIVLAVGSLAAIVGYALFNRYLNEQYHSSMFLATVMPIASDQQYEAVVTRIKLLWQFEYFTRTHYYLLAASALACLIRLPHLLRTEWLWVSQLALAMVGNWAFFWLMGRQFLDHDYYLLAPLWPGLVLLVALATTQAATWRRVPPLARQVALGALLLALLVPGVRQYRARMRDPYLPFSQYYTYRWMQGGAQQLAAAGVPAHDNLLVLGEDAPNLALVYFDRRGLVWNPDIGRMPSAELLEKMTAYGLDCLVMRKAVFQKLQLTHPDVLPAFRLVVNTDQYVLLKRLAAPPHW